MAIRITSLRGQSAMLFIGPVVFPSKFQVQRYRRSSLPFAQRRTIRELVPSRVNHLDVALPRPAKLALRTLITHTYSIKYREIIVNIPPFFLHRIFSKILAEIQVAS